MRYISFLLGFAALPLLISSCMSPKPDLTALRSAVDAYHSAIAESMIKGNNEVSLAFIEDDGMDMAPNMPMAKGKEAIRAARNQMMKNGVKMTSANFTTTELAAGGKIAYEIGTYAISMTIPQMGDKNDNGKYLFVWRVHDDGMWRIHAQMWNTDTPMPPMPSMEQMGKTEPEKKEPGMKMPGKTGGKKVKK